MAAAVFPKQLGLFTNGHNGPSLNPRICKYFPEGATLAALEDQTATHPAVIAAWIEASSFIKVQFNDVKAAPLTCRFSVVSMSWKSVSLLKYSHCLSCAASTHSAATNNPATSLYFCKKDSEHLGTGPIRRALNTFENTYASVFIFIHLFERVQKIKKGSVEMEKTEYASYLKYMEAIQKTPASHQRINELFAVLQDSFSNPIIEAFRKEEDIMNLFAFLIAKHENSLESYLEESKIMINHF